MSAHGAATAQIVESLGKFSLYILLILYLPNASNKLYHVTGEDQLSPQQKKELVIVFGGNIVSDHGSSTP